MKGNFPAVAVCVFAALLGCAPRSASRIPDPSSPTIELRNGDWFDGEKFVDRIMYSVGGYFSASRPARIDTVIDLQQGYVVLPFGDAHNHNDNASDLAAALTAINKSLRGIVIYAQNPANVLRARSGANGSI